MLTMLTYKEMRALVGIYKLNSKWAGHCILIVIPNKKSTMPNVILLGHIINENTVKIVKVADNSWNKKIYTYEQINTKFTFEV